MTIPSDPPESRLLVKVANGGSPAGFRLRFQDPTDPFLPGLRFPDISVSLESETNPRVGSVTRALNGPTFKLGQEVGVSLTATAPTATDMVVREVLPAGASASTISDGGVLAGNTITWDLKGVTSKAVSYKLSGAPCADEILLDQSSFAIDPNEVAVEGDSRFAREYGNDDLGTWTEVDIGDGSGPSGTAEKLGDHSVALQGVGNGIKLTADAFPFLERSVSGDFDITARIDCFDDPAGRGLAALVVRADEDTEGGAMSSWA